MTFWDGKKILVTGGAGFLGSYVVDILKDKGSLLIRIPRSRDMDLRRWENCVKAVEGIDIVIHLAAKVGGIGFNREIRWDVTKPDGQPRRCLDVSRAKKFGFLAEMDFEEGLKRTIDWYQKYRQVMADPKSCR